MSAVIAVNDIVKAFGDVAAIDRVSFEVQAGETFGVVGPPGAGKTTLFQILATLLPPTSGSATVNGFDILQRAGDVRRTIGVMPQAMACDLELTVAENLQAFATLRGVPRAKQSAVLDELLESLGLAEWRNHPFGRLPFPRRRRVELARSLLHAPRVILMDEPTAGFDEAARASAAATLRKIASARDLTVLLTMQDTDEARTLCDRVVVMEQGRRKA